MRDRLSDPVLRQGDIINEPGHLFHGAEVVSSYTRADALQDGVLVDATSGEWLAETRRFFKPTFHVAMTQAVHGVLERIVRAGLHPSPSSAWGWVLGEVLRTARRAQSDEVSATIAIGDDTWLIRAHCGPGDEGEPVITVMLGNED